MLKIAQEIAKTEHAKAIVFGDNLGQVASQTLESIQCLDSIAELPVLRPLITYSKQEIIDLAEKLGTYKISIQPYKDCCSIVSKHPSTKPNLEKVIEQEKKIDLEKIVKRTMKDIESIILD